MSNYSAWEVKASDFPSTAPIEQQIAFLCRYAILAPSVHNSQPWRFEVRYNELQIHIVRERTLGAGDPTGRESWLSLGACIENLLVAADFFGLHATLLRRDFTQVIFVFDVAKPLSATKGLIEAMVSRTSNRSPYEPVDINKTVLNQLSKVNYPGITVLASNDPTLIRTLADLTSRAIAIALGAPSFRTELSTLVHSNWTKRGTGMPGFGLNVSAGRSLIESKLIRSGMTAEAQAKKELAAMSHSGAIVLVFSKGDTHAYWLDAGRAYQRAGLIATSCGLSSSTTAAVVEAADFHLDIEKMVGISGRLQSVMRVGQSKTNIRHSPRLDLKAVLTVFS